MLKRAFVFRLLTIPAFAVMFLFTALMILIGFPFIIAGMKGVVSAMTKFCASTIFRIMFRKISITGRDNLRESRHYVVVANHSSLFDILAIASVMPDVAWFGHERLMKIPVFRRFLILTNYIPMKKATVRNTREMVNMLIEKSKRYNIAIFPEGTRTLDGKINDFYRGFILLIRASEVDVLPVTLNGFYSLKPKNRGYIDFSSRLSMIIHKPFSHEALISMTDSEITNAIRSTIESSLVNDAKHHEKHKIQV
jgi:1-acyl-sn-glycerol-3-phosphate acyltransferase